MTDRAPLVPAEVDLRDFGFMPLDVRRLLTSETWIEAADDPRLGHALMSLWSEAWHQVPAGSLPNNEKVLQRLSMCPNAAEWKRIRERALSGWVQCSDGLLYHPVVAEKALESWAKKRAQRNQTKAATEARERRRREQEAQRNEERNAQRDVHQGTGTVEGTGTVLLKTLGAEATVPSSEPAPEARAQPDERSAGQIAAKLRSLDVQVTAQHPVCLQWTMDGIGLEKLEQAVAVVKARKEGPIAARYLDAVVRDPATFQTGGSEGGGVRWWTSDQGIDAKGKELGIPPRAGETYDDFAKRLREAIRKSEEQAA